MTFIETENINLCVPSKHNLAKWAEWINSSFVRKNLATTKIPKTIDLQWQWIESELSSEKRILLLNKKFLLIINAQQYPVNCFELFINFN